MRAAILLFLVISMFGCKEKTPPFGVQDVSIEEAKKIISELPGLKIIDVRTLEETQEGKLDGAEVIDIQSDDFDIKLAELNREDTYLVYCRSGSRSTRAVEKMSEMGFNRVYMMKGGYLDWIDAE